MAKDLADVLEPDIREQAAAHTLAANPLVGMRGEDILASARVLLGEMASNPALAARQYMTWVAELGRIATGGSTLAPDPKDRRFADPAWRENAAYRALAQSYFAWANALFDFIDEAGIDTRNAERARFLVSLLVDALSPTNSLPGNPAALKRAVVARAFCMGLRILSQISSVTAACRRRSIRAASPSAGISRPRPGRSCFAPM